MQSNERGQVISFYSYKGGVGRTMALANVGCDLATNYVRWQEVLLVDWDLEAPGLHRYFANRIRCESEDNSEQERMLNESPGLMDLLSKLDAVTRDAGPTSSDVADKVFADIKLWDYVLETDIAGLSILKAGRFDKQYASRVNTFDWEGLFTRVPWLFASLAERLARRYAYVLIDSRTGITDVSGICTSLLPEKLVLVFTPNRQSLQGALDVARDAANYRRQSSDLRPLAVFPLPSRIEATEPKLRDLWRYGDDSNKYDGYQPQFETLFREAYGFTKCELEEYFDEVQVQHVPSYAYGEKIAVLEEKGKDRLSLSRSFEKLTAILVERAGPWQLAAEAKSRPTEKHERQFDAIVSYQHADAESVEAIVQELTIRGLKLWIDREQIQPGMALQDSINEAIRNVRSAVVVIGPSGIGRWQSAEVHALISEFARTGFPIIPVLLPGVEGVPREMPLLAQYQSVEFKDSVDEEDIINQLAWGISGAVPKRTASERTAEVYFAYTHEDEPFRHELEKHLSSLKRQLVVRSWHDRKIVPGDDWKGQIDEHLESADLILLLVSADFLASEYCYDLEVKRAMERHATGEALVIPIVVRSCDWSGAPFAKLQALPKDAKPISEWASPDSAFTDVAKGIRDAIEFASLKQTLSTSFVGKLEDAIRDGALVDSTIARIVLEQVQRSGGFDVAEIIDMETISTGFRLADEYYTRIFDNVDAANSQNEFWPIIVPAIVAISRALPPAEKVKRLCIAVCDAIANKCQQRIVWGHTEDERAESTEKVYRKARLANMLDDDEVAVTIKNLKVVPDGNPSGGGVLSP